MQIHPLHRCSWQCSCPFIGYRIGVHHRTIDFHGSIVLWNNQPVTLSQIISASLPGCLSASAKSMPTGYSSGTLNFNRSAFCASFAVWVMALALLLLAANSRRFSAVVLSAFQNSLHACFSASFALRIRRAPLIYAWSVLPPAFLKRSLNLALRRSRV